MSNLGRADALYEELKQKLVDGKFAECWSKISLAFPDLPETVEKYRLAADSLCHLDPASGELAGLFNQAAENFEKPGPFYELGYFMLDANNKELAKSMFLRALSLDPNNSDVALELAVLHCGLREPEQARILLRRFDHSIFWIAYQYYVASLLCNYSEGIKNFIDDSRPHFYSPSAGYIIEALDKLEEMNIRLQTLPQPQPQIRDWHYIQYGAAVLDYMPTRYLNATGGRQVLFEVRYDQLNLSINKLKHLVNELGRLPNLVVSLPDRDSQIIAHAISKLFQLPLSVMDDPGKVVYKNEMMLARWFNWSSDKFPALLQSDKEDSLLVAASSRALYAVDCAKVLKNQTVFVFSLDWLGYGMDTPDIAGWMSQETIFPWEKYQFGNQLNEPLIVAKRNEDTRTPELIANEFAGQISEIPSADGDIWKFEDIIEFYKQHASNLKGGVHGGNKRLRFLTDSPVPSTYYGRL